MILTKVEYIIDKSSTGILTEVFTEPEWILISPITQTNSVQSVVPVDDYCHQKTVVVET